jgi:hypothetical protein
MAVALRRGCRMVAAMCSQRRMVSAMHRGHEMAVSERTSAYECSFQGQDITAEGAIVSCGLVPMCLRLIRCS